MTLHRPGPPHARTIAREPQRLVKLPSSTRDRSPARRAIVMCRPPGGYRDHRLSTFTIQFKLRKDGPNPARLKRAAAGIVPDRPGLFSEGSDWPSARSRSWSGAGARAGSSGVRRLGAKYAPQAARTSSWSNATARYIWKLPLHEVAAGSLDANLRRGRLSQPLPPLGISFLSRHARTAPIATRREVFRHAAAR